MKILLINDYATLTGGAEVAMQVLRDGLQQRGHEVRILASSAGAIDGNSFADYTCFGTMSRFRTLLQTANLWAAYRLRQVLHEFRPDIVHVKLFLTQLSPLILPLLRNVPSLYHVVWYRPICPMGFKMLPDGSACQVSAGVACYHNRCLLLHDWVPLMLQMKLWQHWRDVFDSIVANSQATKHYLMAEGIEPVEVIWNGIPIQPPRPALSMPPTAAFAGRLVWGKGVGDEAFQDKCLQTLHQIVSEGRTVLFVSHDMQAIQRLCPRTIWLSEGRIVLDGATRDVVPCYLAQTHAHDQPTDTSGPRRQVSS